MYLETSSFPGGRNRDRSKQLLGWITEFRGLGVPGEDSLGSRTN